MRSDAPLVSIVTPTFPGREAELERCMQRVLDLDWPAVQHVIVSDRTDLEGDLLHIWRGRRATVQSQHWGAERWMPDRSLVFVQINESWRNAVSERSIGSVPWATGTLLAMGEFVGFCADDDELLPEHVRRHVEAMEADDGAAFSVSLVQFRAGGVDQFMVGDAFAHGRVDATGIMCRASALQCANWSVSQEPGLEAAGDFRLVRDWQACGLRGLLLGGAPTGVHNDGWLVGKTGRPDRPQ